MKTEIEKLTDQVSRLADAMEELTNEVGAMNHGDFYSGKLVDGLFEIARALNPSAWEVKKK